MFILVITWINLFVVLVRKLNFHSFEYLENFNYLIPLSASNLLFFIKSSCLFVSPKFGVSLLFFFLFSLLSQISECTRDTCSFNVLFRLLQHRDTYS